MGSIEKFIKPNKLIEYFDQEIHEILELSDLHSIEFYGWKDEHTIDEIYSGYANWVLNPKIEFDHDAFWNQKPFQSQPSNSDIELMAAGHDFIEIMKAAWLTIGQSLLFKESENNVTESGVIYSNLSLMGTIFELNIASDRVRDFYVLAITGKSYKCFKNKNYNENKVYTKFFDVASQLINANGKNNTGFLDMINKANELSKTIGICRKYRNSLIHVLASDNAVIQKEFLKSQKVWFSKQDDMNFNPFSSSSFDELSLLENQFDFVKKWYLDLIELGNYIFQIEFMYRKL